MAQGAYIVFKTKPFNGYKMGMEVFKNKQAVAIPEKKFVEAKESNKDLCIVDKSSKNLQYMILDRNEIPLSIAVYDDKWGRMETYKLYYYIWKPLKQLTLL